MLESLPCKLGKDLGTDRRSPGCDCDFIQVGQGATMFCVAQRAELRVRVGDGQGYKKGSRFEMM